ncbi:hypothetical protein XENOCAPTIV_030687 [Xenoophorus captivus]|uniref:Uncharacterized protein n=1 Tax=Xenoophorus captivus TaxID=1517983 RepID=A0ABV0R2V9_9TELE
MLQEKRLGRRFTFQQGNHPKLTARAYPGGMNRNAHHTFTFLLLKNFENDASLISTSQLCSISVEYMELKYDTFKQGISKWGSGPPGGSREDFQNHCDVTSEGQKGQKLNN